MNQLTNNQIAYNKAIKDARSLGYSKVVANELYDAWTWRNYNNTNKVFFFDFVIERAKDWRTYQLHYVMKQTLEDETPSLNEIRNFEHDDYSKEIKDGYEHAYNYLFYYPVNLPSFDKHENIWSIVMSRHIANFPIDIEMKEIEV